MEILNDRGYCSANPQPQSVVWERMNLPIARGLRGLLYVLSDLSQVDPSDLCTLCAGPGRFRIGTVESLRRFGFSDPSGQWPGSSGIEYLNYIALSVGAVNPNATDPNAIRRALSRDSQGPASGPLGGALDLLLENET